MMKTTQEKIEDIKKNGYQIDFGDVFNHAFENYKKIALYAGLMIFVFAVLIGILGGVTILFTFGFSAFNPKMLENLQFENLSGTQLVTYLIVSVIVTCLFTPFFAGLIKMAHSAEKDEEFHVSTVFQYYKSPYFQEIILASLIISICTSVLSEVLNYSGLKLVGGLVTFAVSFFTFLTIPLIIFGKLKALEAIKSSIIIISKQPLVLLGLVIVSSIGALVGFIGCCIGVFFTMPFVYSTYYAIYSAIIGFDEENDQE